MANKVEEKPTVENVRLEYKEMVSKLTYRLEVPRGISSPILQSPGGTCCPWCDSTMKEVDKTYTVAVCESNPAHVVVWVPWGG